MALAHVLYRRKRHLIPLGVEERKRNSLALIRGHGRGMSLTSPHGEPSTLSTEIPVRWRIAVGVSPALHMRFASRM